MNLFSLTVLCIFEKDTKEAVKHFYKIATIFYEKQAWSEINHN